MPKIQEHTKISTPRELPLVTIHLRPPERNGVEGHFLETDPNRGLELTKYPRVAKLLKSRKFQFFTILPNQLIFWFVILIGFVGTADPGLNFGTAITWYIWFCLVFVLMVVVGRAWCLACPFGGLGEWVQRKTFWKRTQSRLGLGRKFPESIAQYGFLTSIGAFILLTWLEEFFNIAGPGDPKATSYMVLGIVTSALLFFLIFERRSFCRYVCPLSGLIGTVGSMGMVAGFRTRDREVCLTCETKDCMRGGENGYGCPWYTWPGSADSNAACGLCTECYKGCPSNNVGLFVQRPLTSVIAPSRRRADIAWAVAILWGLVIYQQFNAMSAYSTIDGWLNALIHFPQYPNPIDFFTIIFGVTALMAGLAWVATRIFAAHDLVIPRGGETFISRTSKFRAFFLPLMYGLIPVVGSDYFARQLPKLFKHATRIVPAIGHLFGSGTTSSSLYKARLLADPSIVVAQLIIIGLGTFASMWASWRIAKRDLVPLTDRPRAVQVAAVSLAAICGVAAGVLYVLMSAAD
ncbi:MAG TPA: 4Fe-4S binding protein [Candidatus Nanopelagicaceae bacterium]